MLEFTVEAADLRSALQLIGGSGSKDGGKTECDLTFVVNTAVTEHGFAFASSEMQYTHGQFWKEQFTGLLIGVTIGSSSGDSVIACPASLVEATGGGGGVTEGSAWTWRIDVADLRSAANTVRDAKLVFTVTSDPGSTVSTRLHVTGTRTTYQLTVLESPADYTNASVEMVQRVSATYYAHKYCADHVATCASSDWFSAPDENIIDIGVVAVTEAAAAASSTRHCLLAMTAKRSMTFPIMPCSKRPVDESTPAESQPDESTPDESSPDESTQQGEQAYNAIMAGIRSVAASAQAQQDLPVLKGSHVAKLRALGKHNTAKVHDNALTLQWVLRETFPISSLAHFKERSGSEGAFYLIQQNDQQTGDKYCVLIMLGKTGNVRALSVFAPAADT